MSGSHSVTLARSLKISSVAWKLCYKTRYYSIFMILEAYVCAFTDSFKLYWTCQYFIHYEVIESLDSATHHLDLVASSVGALSMFAAIVSRSRFAADSSWAPDAFIIMVIGLLPSWARPLSSDGVILTVASIAGDCFTRKTAECWLVWLTANTNRQLPSSTSDTYLFFHCYHRNKCRRIANNAQLELALLSMLQTSWSWLTSKPGRVSKRWRGFCLRTQYDREKWIQTFVSLKDAFAFTCIIRMRSWLTFSDITKEEIIIVARSV